MRNAGTLSHEQWRPIYGFLGYYEVSNLGRVKSVRTGKIMNPRMPERRGRYKAVTLRVDGKRWRREVHVLVALSFVGERPSPRHEVRHLDGDPSNNRDSNLAWGTRKDNSDDKRRHGRMAEGPRHGMYGRRMSGEQNGASKLTAKQVSNIRALAGKLTQRQIAANFGVTQGIVWRIIHRKAWDDSAALRARKETPNG